MKTVTKHYRIITPFTFSNKDTVCMGGRNMGKEKPIETIQEAELAIKHFGECKNGTKQNKEYWRNMAKECKIVYVTTIIEDI